MKSKFARLPLAPPYPAMEARPVHELPEGPGWQYEPKWDGFRCLAFRDGAAIELQGKSGKLLTRYFPDVAEVLAALGAGRFVVDSELVIPDAGGRLSFEQLQLRLHPAASRVAGLAAEHPARIILFDLLVTEDGETLVDRPLAERRRRLEQFHRRFARGSERVLLSPVTSDPAEARRWLADRISFDGIMAKRLELDYRGGERTGMQKYKPVRTADCVVGGFRYATGQKLVGSLLLGLYDQDGRLDYVGFTTAFKGLDRRKLTAELAALRGGPGFTGRAPGGPSRWSPEGSGAWEPLAAKLVVEVAFDHVTGGRFRHPTRILRWRTDKAPRQCTLDQIEA